MFLVTNYPNKVNNQYNNQIRNQKNRVPLKYNPVYLLNYPHAAGVVKMDIKEFKKRKGEFRDGICYYENKKFNGKLTTNAKNGDKITLEYKYGLLRSSKTKDFEKEYFYNSQNKLIDVRVKIFSDISHKNSRCESNYAQVLFHPDKIEIYSSEFEKTKEGKRRAELSDDEIKKQVEKIIIECFDKRKIPLSLLPKVEIAHLGKYKGNSYYAKEHKIFFNADSYKSGFYNMEESIAHEVSHCIVEIFKARLDKAIKEISLKYYLEDKILNGENEEILVTDQEDDKIETMKPPKMSSKLRKEFSLFAHRYLYEKYGVNLDNPVIQKEIDKLLDENQDFVEQYQNKQKAKEILLQYAKSHNIRFALTMCEYLDVSQLSALTQAEQRKAIKAACEYIDTINANRVLDTRYNGSGIPNIEENIYNQYDFCAEEAEANLAGAEFLNEKMEQEILDILGFEKFDSKNYAYCKHLKQKATAKIEYYEKGIIWYRKYLQSLHNPDDTELKEEVLKEWEELKQIKGKINTMPLVNVVFYEAVKK